MTYARRALGDLDRLADHLLETDPTAAPATVALIVEAMGILVNHPRIGRPAEHGLRELIISRGHSGYVALYRYDATRHEVLVLALRHQREAGCVDE